MNNCSLSQINQAYIKKAQQDKINFDYHSNSDVQINSQPQKDIVEIQNHKKTKQDKIKTAVRIATVGALIILAALKLGRIHKAKKDITKLYDSIFEQMKEEIKDIDFVKPNLKFTLPAKMAGGYLMGDNSILLPYNQLDFKTYLKEAGTRFRTVNITEGIKQSDYMGKADLYSRFSQFLKRKIHPKIAAIKATYEDFLLDKAGILTHELTHAKQDQILINTDGAIGQIFNFWKKNFPEITFEEFLENNPLYKTQIPNKKFKLGSVLSNNILGSNSNEKGFAYTPQKIIDSITNYTRDNGISYYTNPIEIEARLAEIDAGTKFKKAMPEASNKLEDMVKEKFTYIKILNYNNVAEAFLKQLGKK